MRLPVRRSVAFCLLLVCCVSSDAAAQLRSRLYASGFSAPVAFVQDPGDRTVQYVVEQGGRIRVIKNGVVLSTDFLTLPPSALVSGGEQGLLGLAFPPDFAATGRFYVNFTNPSGHTVVARFLRSSNPLVADINSRFDLRWNGAAGPAYIAQPYANHNGGNLAFSPVDGYLYVGMGDGGSGNDPEHRAQNPAELLGKMLRIDVSVALDDPIGYRVPADNPFVGSGLPGVRAEIWDFGLRNPWRWSFDDPAHGGTGALVIGDVGQGAWEEVDYEPANRGGRNYGWVNREGAHDNVTSMPPAFTPLVDPIHEYSHAFGVAVTGGFVYRGSALGTAFRGRYFFADYGSGRVWSIALILAPNGEAQASNLTEHTSQLAPTGNISSWGVDADGELYFVDITGGRIVAVDPSAATMPVITQNPADSARTAGQFASFTAGASGTPVPGVQWQVSTDGGTAWSTIPGATAATYTFRSAAHDNGRRYRAVFTNSVGSATSAAASLSVRASPQGDLDGDGHTDLVVWRPGTGVWYWLTSASGYAAGGSMQWGSQSAGDVPLLGDVDGDGIRDVIVWRASTGTWYWLTSSSGYAYAASGSKQWGRQDLGDVPMTGDVDGDGQADLIVWRATTGTWYWLTSSSHYVSGDSKQWGNQALGDVPLVADFDGDGRDDLAVWRASTGTWYWLTATSGYSYAAAVSKQWGSQQFGDVPRTGDVDGDGRADLIVWRASTGTWYWVTSSSGYAYTSAGGVQWGSQAAGDQPLVGDFDGDGRADVVVWRPSTGTWFWLTSSTGYAISTAVSRQWGSQTLGDIPLLK